MRHILADEQFRCIKEFSDEITVLFKENLSLRYEIEQLKIQLKLQEFDNTPKKGLHRFFGGAL